MKKILDNLIYKEECYKIIGACFAVYKEKGSGFLEPIHQECLEIEFDFQRLAAVAQPQLSLSYRGRTLRHKYTPDFICFDKIVLEIKAASGLVDEHRAQVLNYLSATGFELGLLVNLGHFPKLEYQRIVRSASCHAEAAATQFSL